MNFPTSQQYLLGSEDNSPSQVYDSDLKEYQQVEHLTIQFTRGCQVHSSFEIRWCLSLTLQPQFPSSTDVFFNIHNKMCEVGYVSLKQASSFSPYLLMQTDSISSSIHMLDLIRFENNSKTLKIKQKLMRWWQLGMQMDHHIWLLVLNQVGFITLLETLL